MRKLIKNGTVINAESSQRADILIEGEKIARVEPGLNVPDAEIIDASGMLILPGGIDPHVHINLPMMGATSSDDYYTVGKAAAFGGTTSVIDFVAQDEGSLAENIARKLNESDGRASVDFGLHMNITRFSPEVLEEIARLPEMGITSVKVFTAYNKRLRIGDGEIFQVMRAAAQHGLLTLVHAENGDVIDVLVAEALQQGRTSPVWHAHTRPAWGEVEASLRAVALAAQADAPVYLVHMNVAGEVDQLAYGRSHGVRAMGETCPQYLFFTEQDLERPDGTKWLCSPPLRSPADQQGLWRGLDYGIIQVLATDHCPFFYDGTQPIIYEDQTVAMPGKELGRGIFTQVPNGVPGVGDRLPVFWTHAVHSGRISPNQFAALSSANPARIFGLYPRKGCLAAGSDADIAIWDPEMQVNYGIQAAKHRTDYNLYEGWQLVGFPRQVFLRGECLVRDGKWFGRPGMGRFLHRQSGEVI